MEAEKATARPETKPQTGGGKPTERARITNRPVPEQIACGHAFRKLARIVERWGPVNREKGAYQRFGIDLVDHDIEGQPLKEAGVLVTAGEVIQRWEEVVGEEYRKTIDNPMPPPSTAPENTRKTAQTLLHVAALPNLEASGPEKDKVSEIKAADLIQIARHASAEGVTNHSSSSDVIVSRDYLHHLELENIAYRRHLQEYELAATDRLEQTVVGILKGELDSSGRAVKPAKGDGKRKRGPKEGEGGEMKKKHDGGKTGSGPGKSKKAKTGQKDIKGKSPSG